MKTVWISATNFGSKTGTPANPFDGSTAEKFDVLMRSFSADTRIRLLDGVFETSGSRNFNEDRGWFVKEGWQIIGNGPERTTIKKVFFPTAAIGNSHAVIQMEYTANGGVTVSDLTVDENWQNDGRSTDYCTYAVHLYGDNCAIRNVWAKNGFGNRAKGREAFTLGISARWLSGSHWEDNVNAVIENCRVSGFLGDYGVAILLAPGADAKASGSMAGYVRNNIVEDHHGTAAFGVGDKVLLEDNISRRCTCDYYSETCRGAQIVGARMGSSDSFNVHLNPVNGPMECRDVVIENNDIEAAHVAVALSGIVENRMSGIVVRNNRITGTGDAVNAEFVDSLRVEQNQVADGMKSHLTNCTDLVVIENDLTGTPEGLEDRP